MRLAKLAYNSSVFKQAWKIYQYSFPKDERRDKHAQFKIHLNKKYRFFGVFEKAALIAFLAEWKLGSYYMIEHIAVKKNARGSGFGTRLLQKYQRTRKKIIIEVPKPAGKLSRKRIQFYLKNGFKMNDFDYIQPSYGKGKKPVNMLLMSFPHKINRKETVILVTKMHKLVYGLDKPLLK